MTKVVDIHAGHRQRFRKRMLSQDIENFEPHEVLEFLLFLTMPRKNTNLLAHALINHFGSISGVLNASVEELLKLLPVATAESLACLPSAIRYVEVDKLKNTKKLEYLKDVIAFAVPLLKDSKVEESYLLCMDAQNRLLKSVLLNKGSLVSVSTSIKEIVSNVIALKSSKVVLLHSHPNGNAVPSQSDNQFTKLLFATLQAMEVCLADHIVVAGETCFSYYRDTNFYAEVHEPFYVQFDPANIRQQTGGYLDDQHAD